MNCPCGQPAQMLLVGARCPECGHEDNRFTWHGNHVFPTLLCRGCAKLPWQCTICRKLGILLALEPLPAASEVTA